MLHHGGLGQHAGDQRRPVHRPVHRGGEKTGDFSFHIFNCGKSFFSAFFLSSPPRDSPSPRYAARIQGSTVSLNKDKGLFKMFFKMFNFKSLRGHGNPVQRHRHPHLCLHRRLHRADLGAQGQPGPVRVNLQVKNQTNNFTSPPKKNK